MPTKTERAKVQIRESSTPDLRTFDIKLTAPTSDFQLTDLLKQRGVIEGIDMRLKQAVKQALEAYLNSAETLIAGLSTNSTSTQRARPSDGKNIGSSQPNLQNPHTVGKS